MWGNWQTFFKGHVARVHVVPYLSAIDLMSLKTASPTCARNLPKAKDVVIERLQNWMAVHAFNDEFITWLSEQLRTPNSDYGLTGSLLLFLLTETDPMSWNGVGPADLDIIYTGKSSVALFLWTKFGITFVEPIGRNRRPRDVDPSIGYDLGYLKRVDTFYDSRNAEKIQLLYVDKSVVNLYVESFDLTFCQNVLYAGNMHIFNPGDVSRCSQSEPIDLFVHHFPRYSISPQDMQEYFVGVRYQRLMRYQERGFSFQVRLPHITDLTSQDLFRSRFDDSDTWVDQNHAAFVSGISFGIWHQFWDAHINRFGRLI